MMILLILDVKTINNIWQIWKYHRKKKSQIIGWPGLEKGKTKGTNKYIKNLETNKEFEIRIDNKFTEDSVKNKLKCEVDTKNYLEYNGDTNIQTLNLQEIKALSYLNKSIKVWTENCKRNVWM